MEAVEQAEQSAAECAALRREIEALDDDSEPTSAAADLDTAAERTRRLAAIEATPDAGERRALLLVELESRCHELSVSLQRERSERRLKQVELDQIYREIQSKAPLIAQQRAEYERVARAHVAVSAALEAAVRQQETFRAKATAAEQQAKVQLAVRSELESQVGLMKKKLKLFDFSKKNENRKN